MTPQDANRSTTAHSDEPAPRRPVSVRAVIALLCLVAGIALVLVAQFPLDGWAEASQFHHQLQHGMIFAGGVAVGGAIVALYGLGRRKAADTPS